MNEAIHPLMFRLATGKREAYYPKSRYDRIGVNHIEYVA